MKKGNGKERTKDAETLEQKLEKIDAEIEALLVKKADILKMIQEAEKAQAVENTKEESNASQ